MHLELPTLRTEGRVSFVGSYMYIPLLIRESRLVGVGDHLTGEVVLGGIPEPYQNMSLGRVVLGDLQLHHVRPHLKPFHSNLNQTALFG